MPSRLPFAILVAVACAQAPENTTIDLTRYQLVDLTHSFNAQTIYWPTSTKTFEHPQQTYGKTPGGWFYSSYELSTPEHGGTHLDAPIHFGEGKLTVDRVPLDDVAAAWQRQADGPGAKLVVVP